MMAFLSTFGVMMADDRPDGKCTVMIKVPEGMEALSLSCSANPAGKSRSWKKDGPAKDFKMSVPAVKMSYISAVISREEHKARVTFDRPATKDQESLVLNIAKPELTVTAGCADRKLGVSFRFPDHYWVDGDVSRGTTPALREKYLPPRVEVFDASGTKSLLKVPVELVHPHRADGIPRADIGYPRGFRFHQYSASIPESIKNGERLIVRVSYEATIFGPITAEKAVTVK